MRSDTPFLTAREAAEYLKVSKRYIDKLVCEERLKPLKPSYKVRRFTLEQLNEFMKSRTGCERKE